MHKQRQQSKKRPRLDLTAFPGEWVALHPETRLIVAHHASLREVEQAAAAAGLKQPLLLAVPKSDAYFVGGP